MIIPAVMFIEMAMDSLKRRESVLLQREAKEFHSLGEARRFEVQHTLLRALQPSFQTEAAAEFTLDPMLAGYLLGLETARSLLATNVEALKARVSV